MRSIRITFLVAAIALVASAAVGQTVVLEPFKNNTLYESETGSLSNGAGMHTFIGLTGEPRIRRTLLAFDVAGSVPAGSTVTSATLTLNVSNPLPNADVSVTLHRVTADWGEGTSDAGQSGPGPNEGDGAPATAGDATWLHTFFDTDTWAAAGGDFVAETSAEQSVGANGSYAWGSTPGMVADVQAWLDRPEDNFGWIVLADEILARSAKRLDSRHNGTPSVRPSLEIQYEGAAPTATEVPLATSTPTPQETETPAATSTPTSAVTETPDATPVPGDCVGDCDGNGVVTINELVRGVNIGLGSLALDTCPAADANGDGIVTVNEIIQAVNNGLAGCPA